MKESVAVAKQADTKKGFSPTKSSDSSIQRLRDEPERQLGSLRGVIGNIRRDGGMPSVESIATQLSSRHTTQRAPVLLALQQTHGNQYVQRVVSRIQAKLKVGQPGDVYEQEADRVADVVMRMPEPEVQRKEEEEEFQELLQQLAGEESEEIESYRPLTEEERQREIEEIERQLRKIREWRQREEEIELIREQLFGLQMIQRRLAKKEEEEILQTNDVSGQVSGFTPTLESNINALRSSGQPLPERIRAFFEPRFGRDFSDVGIHIDSRAEQIAESINAQAFTLGNNIFFGPGRYSPGSEVGMKLIAHELVHVAQQTGCCALPSNDNEIGEFEREAKDASARVGVEQAIHVAPDVFGLIQRDLATPEPEVPAPAQPDLTDTEIRDAIRYNSRRYDEANTRLIQEILGGPVTGRWTPDNIRAIAATQEIYGFRKDGRVGPETFRFIAREQELVGMSTETENCLTMFRVVWHPVLRAATPGPNGTTRIRGHHVVEAQFSNRCDCSEFQYRQFIAGVATASLGTQSRDISGGFNFIPGGALPMTFQEDGMTNCPSINYGHREQPGQDRTIPGTPVSCGENHYMDETDATDQANGCRYRGEDFPEIEVTGLNAGSRVDLLVEFRGEIQRNGTPIQTRRWTDIDVRVITPPP